MPQSQRDHGVAGKPHWLLDEELTRRGAAGAARPLPMLLRHEAVAEPPRPSNPPTDPERSRNGALFALGLSVALAVYVVLRVTDLGGALQDFLSHERVNGATVVTAAFDDPANGAGGGGAELAALRAVVADGPAPAADAAAKPVSGSAKGKKSSTGGRGRGTDDGDGSLDDALEPVEDSVTPVVDRLTETTDATVDALSAELQEAADLASATLDLG